MNKCHVSDQRQLSNPRQQVSLPTIPLQVKVSIYFHCLLKVVASWEQIPLHRDTLQGAANRNMIATYRQKQCSLCLELANHILFFFLSQCSHLPPGSSKPPQRINFIENCSPLRYPWLHGPPPHSQHLTSDFPGTSLDLYRMRKLSPEGKLAESGRQRNRSGKDKSAYLI